MNRTAVKLLGYDDFGGLSGCSFQDLVVEEERGHLLRMMRAVLTSGDNATSEHRLVSRHGRRICLEVTTGTLSFEGEPALMTIGRDITRRQQIQRQMLQTDRLASLGRMAAGMAHEINNPLAYLTANLTFLAEELARLKPATPSSEWNELEDAVDESRGGVVRVRDIVRQLRRFSRVEDEPVRPLDLGELLDGAVRTTWNVLGKFGHLEVEHRGRAVVRANEAQLAQVFINLLSNAAQALVEANAPTPTVRVVAQVEADQVAVAVTDTGPGIPPDVVAKVFDPFFTTKPVGSGTGLGLTVAHSIITGLDGTITVDSEPGAGTTFTVTLPAAETLARAAPASVLILEGELSTVELVQRRLRGHALTFVWSPEQAILATRERRYDAFIWAVSDLEEARRVYEALQPWPAPLAERTVVLTSGRPDAEGWADLPFSSLEKPIAPAALANALDPLIARPR